MGLKKDDEQVPNNGADGFMSMGLLSTFRTKKSKSPLKPAHLVKSHKSNTSQSDHVSLLSALTSTNPEINKILQTLVVVLQAQTISSSQAETPKAPPTAISRALNHKNFGTQGACSSSCGFPPTSRLHLYILRPCTQHILPHLCILYCSSM